VAHDEWSKRWDAIFQRDLPEDLKACQQCGATLSRDLAYIHICTPKENHNA
jgi:hypothetical protein